MEIRDLGDLGGGPYGPHLILSETRTRQEFQRHCPNFEVSWGVMVCPFSTHLGTKNHSKLTRHACTGSLTPLQNHQHAGLPCPNDRATRLVGPESILT